MNEHRHRNENLMASGKTPEARYVYYRRCQVFRGNGEQCKAPAEKSAQICYAHAGQRRIALRREQERLAVLAEATTEMRRRGSSEYEMADLFMDFNGIQVTLAVMARALIDGRIDCRTAGRLAVELQTASKLLWMLQGKKTKISPPINTDNTDPKKRERNWPVQQDKEKRVATPGKVLVFADNGGRSLGPPAWIRAA